MWSLFLQVSQTFAEMMFKHGFVHCDPHAANLLVRPLPSSKGSILGKDSFPWETKTFSITLCCSEVALFSVFLDLLDHSFANLATAKKNFCFPAGFLWLRLIVETWDAWIHVWHYKLEVVLRVICFNFSFLLQDLVFQCSADKNIEGL